MEAKEKHEVDFIIGKIEWKQAQFGKQLVIEDAAGVKYSTFENRITDPAVLEFIKTLKVGDAIAIEYSTAKTKAGFPVRNLEGFLDREPVIPNVNKPGGDDSKMTKEDWVKKDNRIAKESIVSSVCNLLQGQELVKPEDILMYCEKLYTWVAKDD
jgi:hypothetical protein